LSSFACLSDFFGLVGLRHGSLPASPGVTPLQELVGCSLGMPFVLFCRLLRCAEVLGAPFISFFRQVDLAHGLRMDSSLLFCLSILIYNDDQAFFGSGIGRSCTLALALKLVSLPCSPSPLPSLERHECRSLLVILMVANYI